MASGFEQAAIHFLHSYGYVALFVLLALETSMILHFVPSEVIVTVAAATLATNRAQLILVVAVSTLGATAGSALRLRALRWPSVPRSAPALLRAERETTRSP